MMQGGRCPECGLLPEEPGRIVLINGGRPAEGFPDDPGERWPWLPLLNGYAVGYALRE